jgi:hypothetical protein
MTEEVKAPEAAPTAQPETQAAPDLNINDLSALRSILDVASQRGAFKAAELEAVGKIYNKLNSFLEAVTKKEQ